MNKYFVLLAIYLKLIVSAYSNPNINARTGILIDYHSDKILYETDPDAQIYPCRWNMNIHNSN